MKKLIAIACVFLLMANSAFAMTGLEFLRIANDSSKKAAILEPITIEFVAKGYKKVPNWANLGSSMENLIRERGLANVDIKEIALEAAIKQGMTK